MSSDEEDTSAEPWQLKLYMSTKQAHSGMTSMMEIAKNNYTKKTIKLLFLAHCSKELETTSILWTIPFHITFKAKCYPPIQKI